VLVNVGASLIAVGVSLMLVRRAEPVVLRATTPGFEREAWIRTARGLLIIGIAQLVISQQSDLLIVGSIVGTEPTALYGAASQLTMMVSFGQTSVAFVAAPMIADLFARNDHDQLQRLIRVVFRLNALVTLPVSIALLNFGRPILGLYGPGFAEAYGVLVLLVVSSTLAAMVGSVAGFLLTMTRYENAAAYIIGGSAALNLVLTIILTPLYGLYGTAAATLIATLARSAVLVVFIRKRMKLNAVPLT
jgi:O-antigen/teichoic acid export membrane protein